MFKRSMAAVVVLIVGFLWTPAWANTRQNTTPDADHLAFAYDPIFDSTVSAWACFGNDWYGSTGYYLGNGWFGLTAHQATDTEGLLTDELRFYSGRDSANYENMWTADEIVLHPDYTGVTGTGIDFAMAHVSGLVDLEPVTRSYILPERGMEFCFGDFGYFGTASNPNAGLDYHMRGSRNRADFFGGDAPFLNVEPQYMLAEFDPPGYASLELEGHVSWGTSGSPVFSYVDDQWLVTGTMTAARGGFGYFDQSVLLTEYSVNEFIDVRVPEPTTLVSLSAGVLLLRPRRVRR